MHVRLDKLKCPASLGVKLQRIYKGNCGLCKRTTRCSTPVRTRVIAPLPGAATAGPDLRQGHALRRGAAGAGGGN